MYGLVPRSKPDQNLKIQTEIDNSSLEFVPYYGKRMEINMKKHSISKIITVVLTALLISLCATLAVIAVVSQSDAEFGETLNTYQIGLNGRVNLRFIYNSFGSADAFVAEVYTPDGKTLVREVGTYKISDISSNNTVSVPLAPSEMTNIVKVYPVSLDENGNVIKKGVGAVYSVREYALAVISSNNSEHIPYHCTMRALLNWGAMSQSFFDGSEDCLANTGIYTNDTNPITAVGNDTISFTSHDTVSKPSLLRRTDLYSVLPQAAEL